MKIGLPSMLAVSLLVVGALSTPVRAADLTSAYPGILKLQVDLTDAPR